MMFFKTIYFSCWQIVLLICIVFSVGIAQASDEQVKFLGNYVNV